jgi:hypothetical protein
MAGPEVSEQVQEMFDKLLGDKAEATAYSENPEKWLDENGYDDLDPQAVAECGVGYGSGASASASSGGGAVASQPASYSPGVAGVAQAIDPVVYNNYYDNSVDNSITNNIANNGYLDFDQQIVQGDGNVVAGENLVNTGQIQTGDGLQAGGDIDIDDSAVSTGSGDASNISDIDDSDLTNVNQGDAGGDINQSDDYVNVEDSQGVNVDQSQGAGDTTQAAAGQDNDGLDADVEL